MGMSGDYLDAIKYDSTSVRIGSSIFGARNNWILLFYKWAFYEKIFLYARIYIRFLMQFIF